MVSNETPGFWEEVADIFLILQFVKTAIQPDNKNIWFFYYGIRDRYNALELCILYSDNAAKLWNHNLVMEVITVFL